MKKNVFIVLALLVVSAALQAQSNSPVVSDKIEIKWTSEGFEVPESVLPVPEKGIMYVSNIAASNPTEKGGKGFISIVDMDGNIKELKWSEGLNSPKGMAISNGKLYVSEVDKIAAIDLETGKKVKEYPVPGSVFLNDIAADDKGNLYISDSRTGTVHLLKDGEVSVFVKSDDFPGPNGVIVVEKYLFLGTGDKIVKINLKTREISDFLTNTGPVDGIVLLGPDQAVFSDWPGKIHIMKVGSEKSLVYDSSSSETSKTADFGFNYQDRLLYVPTFFDNSLICMQLK